MRVFQSYPRRETFVACVSHKPAEGISLKSKLPFFGRTAAAFLAVAIASCTCSAQQPGGTGVGSDKARRIDELLGLYSKYGSFNGSALVSEHGQVIFKKGYGLANMEWQIPNRPDTKFRLGSITKQFTSMLIMQLVAEGRLRIEDKLSDLLPYYRKDTGSQVTLQHLLTHTSGIPSYTAAKDMREWWHNHVEVEDFVKKHCSGDLEFAPGSKFEYDNSGYFLLGAIIEKVTGKKYEEVLQERIFEPLGMRNSGYDHSGPLIEHRAAGYEHGKDGFVNAEYLDMSIPYAAGSLYSTVEDLYLWDQALYTEKLLSNELKAKMWTPALANYAYGWGVTKIAEGKAGAGQMLIQHGGGINGFNTHEARYVDEKHLVVLLNNTGATKLEQMTEGIAAILYGKPYELPKPSLTAELVKLATEKGGDAAVSEYRRRKKESPDKYDFSEAGLQEIAILLFQSEKLPEAIALLKMNTEEHPKSSQAFFFLGYVLLQAGNKSDATTALEKALELDPKNDRAAGLLKQAKEK
jgi:CubicO group peptidase (beta-lactamase class C family)